MAGHSDSPVFGSRFVRGKPIDVPVLRERWVRDGDWKLVDVVRREARLYNLGLDPLEKQNLILDPEFSVKQSELRTVLDAWWTPSQLSPSGL